MTDREYWKEWLDLALGSMMEARNEDQANEWRYSEDQLAMALYEHLMKMSQDKPKAVRKALYQMRHLIQRTLTLLYARHRDIFPRPKGLGRRKV